MKPIQMKDKTGRATLWGILVVLSGFACLSNALWALPPAEPRYMIFDMRLYQDMEGKVGITTSTYGEPTHAGNFVSQADIDGEQAKLKRIFNATDARLRIDTQWIYDSEIGRKISRIFNKNGSKLCMHLTIEEKEDNIRLEVYDGIEPLKTKNLLDTAVQLPQGNTIILGFKDMHDQVYFVALHRRLDVKAVSASKGEPGDIVASGQYHAELLHYVQPQFPPNAEKAGIEGTVRVRAFIDASGNVLEAKVLDGHPLLRPAAVDAVRQFKYKVSAVDRKANVFPLPISALISFTLPQNHEKEETGTIVGKITLEDDGSVIAGVHVTCVNKKMRLAKSGESDKNGTYSFTALPPGDYVMTYEKEEYLTLRQQIYLNKGESLKRNVYFKKNRGAPASDEFSQAVKRFTLKQKLLSLGDKYYIKDEADKSVYTIKGKAFTLGKKLSFRDMNEKELLRITQKPFSLGQKAYVSRDGTVMATVVRKYSLKEKFHVTIPGGEGIEVAGNFVKYKYAFIRAGRTIAQVAKKFVVGSDRYGVEIDGGEDEALILAIVVIIDLFSHNDN